MCMCLRFSKIVALHLILMCHICAADQPRSPMSDQFLAETIFHPDIPDSKVNTVNIHKMWNVIFRQY